MSITSNNFTIKQIGSWWRVVGPGGKLINGNYRLRQQALEALKKEVDKLLEQRNFGFLKETSLIITEELKKEQLDGKEDTLKGQNEGNALDDNGKITKGHEIRHENDAKKAKYEEQKRKKRLKLAKSVSPEILKMLEKHNL